MEFGIHESLGVYSGGLGVLAGDHCKAASDLGVPLVGVGLLYRSGYFRQTVDADGFQQHIYPDYDFARLPVLPVQAPGGGVLTVPIDLPGRVVQAAVWKAQVGHVPVLMLDTDIPLNDPADRPITGVLYVRGREMRLCQEIVLGIGGVRALRALGIQPAVWHMNEGHVAFLGLERARERVRAGDGLARRLRRCAEHRLHHPHPGARRQRGLRPGAGAPLPRLPGREVGVRARRGAGPRRRQRQLQHDRARHPALLEHQRGEQAARRRSPRPCGGTCGRALPQSRSAAITNGVHTESWIGPEMRALYAHALDPRLGGAPPGARVLDEDPASVPDAELWAAHRSQKERLIRFVRERVRQQSARHGSSPDELRAGRGPARSRTPSPSASPAASRPTSGRSWCSPTSTACARC